MAESTADAYEKAADKVDSGAGSIAGTGIQDGLGVGYQFVGCRPAGMRRSLRPLIEVAGLGLWRLVEWGPPGGLHCPNDD